MFPIEITVGRPAHLFHALDPSPLVGRDLDEKIERYILHVAQETSVRDYALIVHTTEGGVTAVAEALTEALGDAIRAYFAHRRNEEAQKLRLLFREGRQASAIGLAFLSVCVVLGLIALRMLPDPFGFLLEEGLLIVGWVANWRPIEIFLYDWRPIRAQRNLFEALARMPISFRSTGSSSVPTGRNVSP